MLAAVGSAVGLGNMWRFSYLTAENGGAAFVFVYLLCVFLIGLPVWSLFAIGGVLPPLNGVAVYASAVVAYLAVFVWHKFR